MFLTTLRVRRPKASALDRVLTTRQLQNYPRGVGLVEVTVYGQSVAIIDVKKADEHKGTAVLWANDAYKDTPQLLNEVVRGAVAVMQVAGKAGLNVRQTTTAEAA